MSDTSTSADAPAPEKAEKKSRKKKTEEAAPPPADLSNSAGLLRALVERIERLRGEQQVIGEDIAAVYREVKAAGLDKKTVREVVRVRAKDPDQRRLDDERVKQYLELIGE